ncbi:dTDP-4-amino-4,6-dideoxyglucose formyltransferase [Lysinibacillus irui]|uniref:dTDP-4-amino-4,6-dideoxyglucose formyltransferase n=1 Tax=Lysinibacillus irui TaxID=2998077 RepID=A0AAJ5UTU4_9BACI|nr:dTDP-4-amino-4,6-dideoxyglucose formyltransferase [Lysinibacillus irui]WDV07464.1 dTDP-4-amino-4,6-dideoxyglucose formyltransferase [Lysinibacillus irui]
MKVLVLTDNQNIYEKFLNDILNSFKSIEFDFYCSPNSKLLYMLKPLNIKKNTNEIIGKYSLVISLHCRQIFPEHLLQKVLCVNIHPGYNPYNRGWYPHIFGIINKKPIGATLHIMDAKIDNGPVIDRILIKVEAHETSLEVYNKILDAEIKLLKKNLAAIFDRTFKVMLINNEAFDGINYEKDFINLCEIDLESKLKFQEAIDYLRAMSHGEYKNAYFYNEKGEKIYVQLKLFKEEYTE